MSKTYGEKMTECVEFLATLDEGDMVDLMKEFCLTTGADRVIDMKLAAQTILEGLKDME